MKSPHKEVIILLGKPGSGKGTQAEPLAKMLGLPFVSMGKLLRAEIKNKTAIGTRASADVAAGRLVDNKITNTLLRRRLEKSDAKKGIIIDGCPRDLVQAQMLEKIAHVTHAILISITDAEVIERISGRRVCTGCGLNYHVVLNRPKKEGTCDRCGASIIHRDDDKPKIIRERLKSYREDTIPVLHYYRRRRALRRIDGVGTIGEVSARAIAAIQNSDKGLKIV